MDYLEKAKRVLDIEIFELQRLRDRLGEEFSRAVQLINYTIKYERAFEASAALKDYFLEQIEQRRAKPTQDIIGDLVSADIEGEKLSDEAI